MSDEQSSRPVSSRPISAMSTLMGRIIWSGLGPVILIGLSLGIVLRGGGWFTVLDLLYAAVIGLIIWGRVVEHRSGEATTMAGERATAQHFRRYMQTAIPVMVVLWALANVFGNYVLT